MWITKDGVSTLINDGTFPYWRAQGWEIDANVDLIGDEAAAAATLADALPAAIGSAAAVGTSAQLAREDHVHTGQKLAAIAAPSGGLTVDAQARTAIDAIRAALTAHGITL